MHTAQLMTLWPSKVTHRLDRPFIYAARFIVLLLLTKWILVNLRFLEKIELKIRPLLLLQLFELQE